MVFILILLSACGNSNNVLKNRSKDISLPQRSPRIESNREIEDKTSIKKPKQTEINKAENSNRLEANEVNLELDLEEYKIKTFEEGIKTVQPKQKPKTWTESFKDAGSKAWDWFTDDLIPAAATGAANGLGI